MEKLRAMRDEVNNLPSKCLALILPLLLWPILGFADEPFSINGYYKNFSVVFSLPKYETSATLPDQPPLGAVNNRLRLKLFYNCNTWFSLNAAYDFSPRIQDPLLFENQPILVSLDPFKYRALDFEARLYPAQNKSVGSFGIFHNLDRALMTVKTALADIVIGRQAIAWGSARVLNPTDILAPFSFEELDTEERIGVDAVRIRVPLSALAEFDAGYVFGKDFRFKQSAFFTRAKFYMMKTDVALLLLGFREHFLAGIDIARSIGGAGFWLEAAYVFAEFFSDTATGKGNDYFRGTIGLDYALSAKTYGFIEYHFSEAGAGKPENYLKNINYPAFTDGAVYLLGRHYLAPGLTHQITPLISFSGQALLNLADQSLFVSPTVEYNIAENIYVSAGAFFGIGKGPKLVIDEAFSPVLKFHSEFGGYPDIYFSSFRIYF